MVGATGFEPAASWSQTKCSTRLSYAPVTSSEYHIKQALRNEFLAPARIILAHPEIGGTQRNSSRLPPLAAWTIKGAAVRLNNTFNRRAACDTGCSSTIINQ